MSLSGVSYGLGQYVYVITWWFGVGYYPFILASNLGHQLGTNTCSSYMYWSPYLSLIVILG